MNKPYPNAPKYVLIEVGMEILQWFEISLVEPPKPAWAHDIKEVDILIISMYLQCKYVGYWFYHYLPWLTQLGT